jgi:hypothetical protein
MYIYSLMPPGVPRGEDELEDAIIIDGPPRPNLAVRFSKDDGLDNALRSDSASALDGARPALDSLEALPSEVYWADLPKKERIKWMIEEELAEDKREWSGIWRTFKEDPLQPVRDYFHQYVITGIGLFLEGYVVRFCAGFQWFSATVMHLVFCVRTGLPGLELPCMLLQQHAALLAAAPSCCCLPVVHNLQP